MATITAEILGSTNTRRILWEAMGNEDVGSPVAVGGQADGSVQVAGTFGSATVVLQGSNDGTNWFNLTDELGAEISITTAGGKMFLPRTWKVRPSTSGGSGTDLDVYLVLGSQR